MTKLLTSLLFLGFAAAIASPAAAAKWPQALGLVATAMPVPMQCQDGRCDAVLSAFCLQQKRRSPSPADLYAPTRADHVRLAIHTADGRMIPLDGARAEFRPDPEYTSVRISISANVLSGLAGAEIRVSVASHASLVPVGADETDALRAATGPHRQIAAGFFENGDTRTNAVDLANRLLNALPRNGRLASAQRQSVWRRTVRAAGDVDPQARQWIGELYRNCGKAADMSERHTLRRCLGAWHHRSLSGTNKTFWSALPGV